MLNITNVIKSNYYSFWFIGFSVSSLFPMCWNPRHACKEFRNYYSKTSAQIPTQGIHVVCLTPYMDSSNHSRAGLPRHCQLINHPYRWRAGTPF